MPEIAPSEVFRDLTEAARPAESSMAPALHLAHSPVAATRTALVIMNPVAGGGRSSDLRAHLEECLSNAGYNPAVYETNGRDEPGRTVKDAVDAGCALVVAVGGDGTVSQAASGLLGTEVPLLIVPAGTANLVAREFAIPLDLVEAARVPCQAHRVVAMDAMRVGETLCLCKVSLGVYSQVVDKAGRPAKKHFGRLAYLWWLFRELLRKKSWRFHIDVDGRRERVRASMVAAVNVGAAGLGDLRWGENIDPGDGVVDLVIVRTTGVLGYVALILRSLFRKVDKSPQIRRREVRKRLRITTRSRLALRGDGEVIGSSKADIEILPHAICVVVPDGAEPPTYDQAASVGGVLPVRR